MFASNVGTTCSSSSSTARLAPRASVSTTSRVPARARALPSLTTTMRSPLALGSSEPPPLRRHAVVALASSTSSSASPSSLAAKAASAGPEVREAISTLKRAAQRAWAVPTSETLAAILVLEKAKLIQEAGGDDVSWLESIAGGRDGRRWRLMFTSGTDQVRKAVAGDKAGGVYVPITAVQRWRREDSLIENGIYLGFVGAFVFRGSWEAKKNRLSFDFDTVRLRVGPWSKEFELKKKSTEEEKKKGGAGPFFLFAYADDDICVARGRSGGVAMWARASADWQVKAGIDA